MNCRSYFNAVFTKKSINCPKMMWLTFLVVLLYGVVHCAKFIPDYIPLCKYNDPNLSECYKKSFMIAVKHMNDGIPEMNLMKIDPLVVETLSLNYGNGSAVSFGATVSNLHMDGLPNLQLVDAQVDLEKLTWTLKFFIKELRMQGKFNARGRILLLRFDSEGSFNGNLTDVECLGVWKGKKVKTNDKEHIKFIKSDVDLHIKEVKIRFDNLFPTQEINDQMNAVINDNMDVFYDELKPVFINTVKRIIIDSVNNVYNLFPFEKLYPK